MNLSRRRVLNYARVDKWQYWLTYPRPEGRAGYLRGVGQSNQYARTRRRSIGSYSTVHLGPLYVGGDKNGVDPLVMMLFRPTDKVVRPITRDDPEWSDFEMDEADEDPIQIVRYVAPASIIRDRLDFLGFTLQTARKAFDASIAYHAADRRERMSGLAPSLPADFVDEEASVLSSLSADVWMSGLKEIRDRGLRPAPRTDETVESLPALLQYMLGRHFDGWYGFPSSERRHALRLAVEVCPTDDLVYELTDLVAGGYYDSSDDVVEEAEYLLTEHLADSQRVVVLTEGASDKWVLERSIELLQPHLADYFTFMDFEGAKVAGGAGALAAMVKAFVGARILNRVVAIFDNDTAARVALRSLEHVAIPRHIAVLQYPTIVSASAYPTIGPTGVAEMDVNGLAGSIELYLGRDVLSDGTSRIPVQWKGFEPSVNQYQGELITKRDILERFRAKLSACEAQRDRLEETDWQDIRAILAVLCSAFHRVDEEDLVAAAADGQ